jgi:hypothetical protein
MARQCADQCLVAVRRRRHVAHSVGDLVDLAPDIARGLEHHDVELDVEALDRCAHACCACSDHDHVVECFDWHEPTLRPCSGPVVLRASCRINWIGAPGSLRFHSLWDTMCQQFWDTQFEVAPWIWPGTASMQCSSKDAHDQDSEKQAPAQLRFGGSALCPPSRKPIRISPAAVFCRPVRMRCVTVPGGRLGLCREPRMAFSSTWRSFTSSLRWAGCTSHPFYVWFGHIGGTSPGRPGQQGSPLHGSDEANDERVNQGRIR